MRFIFYPKPFDFSISAVLFSYSLCSVAFSYLNIYNVIAVVVFARQLFYTCFRRVIMLDSLKEFKLEDNLMEKIEGGFGTSEEAKQLQLTALDNIFHFGKNVPGGNLIFTEGSKKK